MKDKEEIDRQFDCFLTRNLDIKVPIEIQERLQQGLKAFRPPMKEGSFQGRFALPLWKYAAISGFVLALIAGIYLYGSFKSDNKIPLQVVCLQPQDGQPCNLIANQGSCLAQLLKECLQSKTHVLALKTKIGSGAIEVQVSEETGSGSCGKPGAPAENRRALKVVVQIKEAMALAQKESLVQKAIEQCPICEESQKLACVSYEVL
jgi:hypothetical protein